jgi:hypothetical protein
LLRQGKLHSTATIFTKSSSVARLVAHSAQRKIRENMTTPGNCIVVCQEPQPRLEIPAVQSLLAFACLTVREHCCRVDESSRAITEVVVIPVQITANIETSIHYLIKLASLPPYSIPASEVVKATQRCGHRKGSVLGCVAPVPQTVVSFGYVWSYRRGRPAGRPRKFNTLALNRAPNCGARSSRAVRFLPVLMEMRFVLCLP